MRYLALIAYSPEQAHILHTNYELTQNETRRCQHAAWIMGAGLTSVLMVAELGDESSDVLEVQRVRQLTDAEWQDLQAGRTLWAEPAPAADLDCAALEILEEGDAPADVTETLNEALGGSVAGEDACPACGETAVDRLVWDEASVQVTCSTCGHTFTPGES